MATDPVIKDHQLWIGFAQPEGLVVSPAALKNAQAFLSRNVGPQQEILRRNAVSDFDGNLRLKNFPAFTQEFWGWRDTDLAAPPEDLFARLPEYGETLRPTWVVRGGKGQPDHLILVEELPWGTDFDKAAPQSEERRWQASPQARFERMLRETGVGIGLLTSPERIRLVYAPKGESSGHVTFPVHQMTMAVNWPLPAALHLLLHSDRLFIGPEAQRLPAILEASRRYQNEVSIRLAGQVLRALNELVRGFQDADRAAKGRILGEALRHDPSHIYGGMLTTLMRMVFVLYAEDRSLMGSDETWLQNYSISGLYERLRADAGQYPDTMDSRYGAWAQIITLTRLLYDGGGHGTWRLPPRHGGLFDPDAYPFLEGRPWQSKRAAGALIEPPLVSDGILFRILQDLLYLDGERISYRALDVEQIGSVYEAMMGFTVETAHGVSIGLGSDHLVIDLEALVTMKPADRAKWLKENAGCDVTGKAIEQLKSASSVDELLAALRRRISKLYLDLNSNPVAVPKDGIYLQPTEERRRSGSHYTPRSLTQPIVKTTLDPVLAQLGENPRPEQILALKVCDPAMGSGAFLVEACRYLGEKLEKAWIAHDEMPGIPADQDPLLHARRIVAQRCLYGVDKNPFAVNLAKLSLWLATFAKDHPFTFVDHTLRCGDSLVGLTAQQIEAFHWQPKEEGALLRDLPSRLRHILNARAQILDAADETPYETLAQKLAVTEEQMIDLRLAGDLTIAAFFGAEKLKDRDRLRKKLAEEFRLAMARTTDLELDAQLRSAVRTLAAGPKGVAPFHWELEFPEVFRLDQHGRRENGFDAFVGNPPFAGKNTLIAGHPNGYLDWLKMVHDESHGNADLVAHFFRRAFSLLGLNGYFGLIATNTIGQGDTRATGLRWICTHGGTVYNAMRRYRWPGAAAVIVSIVHVCRGPAKGPFWLDGRIVPTITAYLFHAGGHDDPSALSANAGKSSVGSYVLGLGFVFDDTDSSGQANHTSLMKVLIENNPRNAERIFPYIGGEAVNDSPTHSTKRYVIDFGDLDEATCRANWPDLMELLEERVKPMRARDNRASYRAFWWQYAEKRGEIYRAIRGLDRLLVTSQVSKYRNFVFLDAAQVFDQRLVIFAASDWPTYTVLQSQAHQAWEYFLGATLKDDPTYTPSTCFHTFPFPDREEFRESLTVAGRNHYEFRADLMVRNNDGLTAEYNRFHDPRELSPAILKLRELQESVDRAVLQAYEWHDLAARLTYAFVLAYDDIEGDEEQSPLSGTPQKPWRYRWPNDLRDEVLARLLELNRICAEEEQLGPGTYTRNTEKHGRKSRTRVPLPPSLFDDEAPPE
jgi:N-6 DNA Methylase